MKEAIEPTKRPRARKLKGSLGPFSTGMSTYDAGKERPIEITVNGQGVIYRLKGQSQQYLLPHAIGYQKAVSLRVGVNIDPRQGRMKRGEQHI